MLKRVMLFGLLGAVAVALVACAPPPEPPAVEEEPAPPPPPPPPVYELTEVDIIAEEPEFTSRNIAILGVKVGDVTNDVGDLLGDIDNTITLEDDYKTAYQGGGLVVYTFKLTGIARRIEITAFLEEDLVAAPLQDWLDDGDVDQMRELMGEEEGKEEFPDNDNATEYVYDSRGIRFVTYDVDGFLIHAIRFSEYRD